ncbi:MAG: UDP-N-acetylmuramoyl-L-alanine--D-glutamate ligase [Candidatus Sabulitectum sp.]|nr:UDP-N-acetylmuramoyl-L-alanine--D-glutamate ligase [Candidatus Sabulitectum sp.]
MVGLGRSGYAAARLLADRGFTVTGFDSSFSATATEHISTSVFGDFLDDDLQGLSVLVLSPGVPPSSAISLSAYRLHVPVIGEIELAWLNTTADVLAVTGSNGKTTTVEWLSHVIRSSKKGAEAIAAGNMGYALSDAILDHPGCPLFVVELSSYQLETTESLKASSAVILNLTPDHLARHGTMENYGAAKARVFMNQGKNDSAILNFDDPLLRKYRNISGGLQMYFSLKEEVLLGSWLDSSGMLMYRDGTGTTELMHHSRLSLPGRHNIANALAVVCMAASYGISVESIVPGLTDFPAVAHRIEPLGMVKDLLWFNDSKSTNVDSLKVALESFNEKVILLAGGKEKNSDYSILRELIEDKVKALVLFGSGAEFLSRQWKGTVRTVVVSDLEDAVEQVQTLAVNGDTILLSPGCASFDQYKDFEERGNHFKELVQALK